MVTDVVDLGRAEERRDAARRRAMIAVFVMIYLMQIVRVENVLSFHRSTYVVVA